MSREFNNGVTTDRINYTFTTAILGAQTVLAVCRIMEPSDTVWISVIEHLNAADSRGSIGRRSNGNIYYSNDAGIDDRVTWNDSDNWCLVAATKAAGSNAANFYKIPIGGSTTTQLGAVALVDNANAGTVLTLGGPSDPAYIRLGVAAIYNIVLSQAQLEAIASAKTTQSIYDLTPLFLADDGNNFDTDYMATLTGTKTGTSHNADDPSGWVYGLGVTSQKGYAVTDSVDGTWTDNAAGTALAAAIDETSPSDADYIQSVLGPVNTGCRIKAFNTLLAPQSGTRTLRWRTGKDATGGPQIDMTVKLYQGGGNSIGAGTLVQSFSRNNVDAITTYEETVTGTITDYSDLYVEFFANQV